MTNGSCESSRGKHRRSWADPEERSKRHKDSHHRSRKDKDESRAKRSENNGKGLDHGMEEEKIVVDGLVNGNKEEDEEEEYRRSVSRGLDNLAKQEEDDRKRLEESRRLRQAILEKHRNQQKTQKQIKKIAESSEHVSRVEVNVQASSQGEGVLRNVAESSLTVPKSPSPKRVPEAKRPNETGGHKEGGTPKSEGSYDMFCESAGKEGAVAVEKSGPDCNWDDAEGYYGYRLGESLNGRYQIIAAHGKGVYSNVVRAKDLQAMPGGQYPEVAIKILRNNRTMYKAGMDEVVILNKLVGADPDDKRHCVRYLSNFMYRNHLCLVFESLHMNLRGVIKKFGRDIGLRLTAVRTFAEQLFIALKHLKNCGVLHCDIKPDNMLLNEEHNVLKLCDFGNAMFSGENEPAPYLVSRFYRAPEIILGLPYDHPLDMWSVGCSLFELYTGKVLFPGATNNDMLRLHMEQKGPFPRKMLRKGQFTNEYFDRDLNFLATYEDPVTKEVIRRPYVNTQPNNFRTLISGSSGENQKMVLNFKDLMEKIFVLNPDKRLTVSQALSHPFITRK